MEGTQFPEGATRLEKLVHWSVLGAAPDDQSKLTKHFCKAGNATLQVAIIPYVVGGSIINAVANKSIVNLGME